MKEGQKAIYFMTGDDRARLEASPQLEGFRSRGVEVLLLTDPIDSFWVTMIPEFDGKPLKSVTQRCSRSFGHPLARTVPADRIHGKTSRSPPSSSS